MNNITFDISELTSQQVEQIYSIIEAFKAKNEVDRLEVEKTEKTDIIDSLTTNPLPSQGFLTREEIYDRSLSR